MRPRLRDDVRYAQCPEGAYVHGFGGACTVKGVQAFEWLSRLAPHLKGEYTLDQLVGALEADQRAMVEELVGMLTRQGFVVDAVSDEAHSLDAEEQRVYAAEIAFIRYGLDSAERRFQRVREARIVLIGEGPVVTALLGAGLWSGWRQVRVLAPSAEIAALRDVVETTRRDHQQSVRLEPWTGTGQDTELACIARDADVVLQVCGQAHRADLIAASRVCAGSQTAVGQVLLGADEAYLTPVGAPDRIDTESCWRRLAAQRDAETASDEGWLTGPVPDLVAAQLALSCFSHLSGLDALERPEGTPPPPMLTRVDLRTLTTRTHRVLPHPLAAAQASGSDDDARALFDELAEGAVVEVEDLLDRAAAGIDPRTGLLGVLEEGGLSQVPLSVCRASVSDPDGVLPAWAPMPTVLGWGVDQPTARVRTVLAALATYGTLCGGSLSEAHDRVWGLDLVTGQVRAVPVRMVYPVLSGALMPYQAPVGAAAGRVWRDAVAAGLRAQCQNLLGQVLLARVSGPRSRQAEPRQAEPRQAEPRQAEPRQAELAEVVTELADEQLQHLLTLVQAVDQRICLEDHSGVLGLPAFALRTDADPVVFSCATTAVEALRDGLERSLLGWQIRAEGLPSPGAIRWPIETTPQAGGPDTDPRCAMLTDALHRAGHVPVAVPITVDRQARNLLPYVVQVVLCDD